MNEYVWISDAMPESTLILRVNTDIVESSEDAAIEGQRLNLDGKPVPVELCPKKIWGDDTAPAFKTMPDLF